MHVRECSPRAIRVPFERDGMGAASASVWSVALEPGKTLTYGVERPGRSFFVEFDLTHEVPAPPSPWGAE